eukprot:CAMPEP_0197036690 /NCGR_PEP_ID=MMETSP1384-20130603/14124_1 /TAXON_ID=29189 /ORGANISM="Ammonia sp." /LENGTH=543 /DNA_ID=CAMNT_0042466891 /DNA_START=171 /DNA_END=1802 /DNA_ORIENTATION=+
MADTIIKLHDTVIIGGGISGLTAAALLNKQHINVCLIEAKDQLGGRAQSENWGTEGSDYWIDIGCQWIHYANKTQHQFVHDLWTDFGIDVFSEILTMHDVKNSELCESKVTDANGWILYDMETRKQYPSSLYTEITDTIIDYLDDTLLTRSYRNQMKQDPQKYPKRDYCLQDLFMDSYNECMLRNIHGEHDRIRKLKQFESTPFDTLFMQRCIDWALAWFEDYESLLCEESYYHWFDDEPVHHDDLDMNGKFGKLVEQMAARGIDSRLTEVRLNTECESISYNACADRMEIVTRNAQNGQRVTYHCKHVVVAVSVCCLQKRTIQIHDLKPEIWNTIDKGWGMLYSNKIIIQFDGPFQRNNHVKRLSILSPQKRYTEDDEKCTKSVYVPGMNQKYSMSRRHNNSNCNIWNTFLTPRYSEKLSCMNEDEMEQMILTELLAIFANVFGDELPKILRYKMTHWDRDRLFNGSWCYWRYNGGGLKACKRMQNLENRNLFNQAPLSGYNHQLLFAGDYTESGTGCAYDAYRSGKRVAEQIINVNTKTTD